MNKTELLHLLEETVPPLRGKLHIERVLYQKAANKAYMSFLSDELVTEHDYLLLERRLRELFPKLTVALRIASPSLGEKFLADLEPLQTGPDRFFAPPEPPRWPPGLPIPAGAWRTGGFCSPVRTRSRWAFFARTTWMRSCPRPSMISSACAPPWR